MSNRDHALSKLLYGTLPPSRYNLRVASRFLSENNCSFIEDRLALQKVESERVLYLAVPLDTYRDFFADSFVEAAVEQHQLKMIVFNPKQEEIVLWKD